MPKFRDVIGKPCIVTLYEKDKLYLESATGICRRLAINLPGEQVGELAEVAQDALNKLRTILDASPPKKLTPKPESK
jgi:hypothetical protein